MEKKLIVANWKENFTVDQAQEWLEKFRYAVNNLTIQQFSNVVICPSFVILPMMAYEISKLEGIKLGAQDVSKFEEGQYTGEVSAKMLRDFVSHVIVGHSERREHFGETDEGVKLKVEQCLKYNLTPIVCVSSIDEVRSGPPASSREASRAGKWEVGKVVFAYEPLFAVGTGEPDTPENAQKFAEKLKAEVGHDVEVLYGGSVNAKNAKSFVSQPDISGILVGEASLDAEEFAGIIKTL